MVFVGGKFTMKIYYNKMIDGNETGGQPAAKMAAKPV
jgi:hypothetical protein